MKISISTTAKNGHLICHVINGNDVKILSSRDSDSKECMLASGMKYRFEWHVWSSTSAEYKIEADVIPTTPGFPPFNWDKSYDGAHQDMGGFYFTV